MPKYLIAANYVGDGVKGLLKEGGTSRRAAAEKAISSVGGKLEAFYYAFGDTDAYVIADLLTPEELDQAVKKAPGYRAPGQ